MIEQCEKCDLYNSLGCPYDYDLAVKLSDCDEFRPAKKEKEIKILAEKRRFTLWATISGRYLQFMDRFGINLIVEIETGEFELKWSIPKSIFTVECPSCSPFSNDEHFYKIYRKFKHTILKIKEDLSE